ncbi:MAG: hypothetical protein JWR72_3369 [Flavisolibacter sp.]|jgi:hypothetical protein|nr:hypothetical protein [Flavisolibacter sp.]
MRKTFKILIATIFVFMVLTLVTMKEEASFDGDNTYGFPLTFHIQYSGMCDPCPESPTSTNFLKMLIDLILALVMGIVLIEVIDFVLKLTSKKAGE